MSTSVGNTTPVPQGGQTSIQVLLDAEKEASAQVAEARQCKLWNINHYFIFLDRVQRLKDARNEAEGEIEALKAAKKEEFQNYEQSIVNVLEDSIKVQAKKTEEELRQAAELAAKNREVVLKLLVDKVLDVQPTLHPNALHKQNM